MPAIKSLDRISKKWARVAAVSQENYTEGINNPRADWKTQTLAAEKNYDAAIQKAISQKRFGKGVSAAGTEKWKRNALEKGPARWSQGIAVSTDAFEKGFAPYAEVIKNTTLPARGPKGDPANINRVAVMAKALHDKKESLAG